MKKQKTKLVFFILSIVFSIVAIFACVSIGNDNENFKMLILLSVLKALPMVLIFLTGYMGAKETGINSCRKFLLIAFFMSAISDITIVFNVVIGGLASLASMVFLIASFYKHHVFKRNLVQRKIDFEEYSFYCIIAFILFYCFFILYCFISVFPFLSEEFIFFKEVFPIYMLFLSVAVGFSFFGRVSIITKIGIVSFFISDSLLLFNFSFGFPLITVIASLFLYYFAQNIFAISIDK